MCCRYGRRSQCSAASELIQDRLWGTSIIQLRGWCYDFRLSDLCRWLWRIHDLALLGSFLYHIVTVIIIGHCFTLGGNLACAFRIGVILILWCLGCGCERIKSVPLFHRLLQDSRGFNLRRDLLWLLYISSWLVMLAFQRVAPLDSFLAWVVDATRLITLLQVVHVSCLTLLLWFIVARENKISCFGSHCWATLLLITWWWVINHDCLLSWSCCYHLFSFTLREEYCSDNTALYLCLINYDAAPPGGSLWSGHYLVGRSRLDCRFERFLALHHSESVRQFLRSALL